MWEKTSAFPTYYYKYPDRLLSSMGQQDVCDFLKEHPNEWFTSREISGHLSISLGSITVTLKKLREHDELLFLRIGNKPGKRQRYRYKHKG